MRKILSLFAIIILTGAVNANSAPDSFADLVEELSPAVVNISTEKERVIQERRKFGTPRGGSPFGGGSPFENFSPFFEIVPEGHPFHNFKDFFNEFQPQGFKPQSYKKMSGDKKDKEKKTITRPHGLGSGFIISKDGYVVTNYHVIEGADEITVTLNDEREFIAKIIGTDEKTDIALLKIEGNNLPFVKFGDSDKTRVGDWTLVIGNPFGLGGTVTAGIVSARQRDINAGSYDDFIQTDASINKGNSGGPMFNLKGEVIGISTAIYSPNGVGNVGIGFAIPSVMAENVINQLKNDGSVRRGWLGVKIQTITEEIAESLDIDEEGALVSEVVENSPAQKSGIQVGDVIVRFNDKRIKTMRELPRVVASTEVGKTVPVKVIRGDNKLTLDVKVEELEDENKEEPIGEIEEESKESEEFILGIKLTESEDGLKVSKIDSDSITSEAGLRVGDIIFRVNRTKVDSINKFQGAIDLAKRANRKSILLLIIRDSESFYLPIELN